MSAQLAALAALLPAAALAMAPPAALAPAAAAPTGVTVAWAAGDHRSIAATWQETGDEADHITLNTPDGKPVEGYWWDVAAGHPNELTFSDPPPDLDLRLTVQPVDAAGQPVGDAGRSPVFDTDQPAKLTLAGAVPRADGTVLLTWKATVPKEDTPDDPLDLPAVPVRFIPFGSDPEFNTTVDVVTTPITDTSFVVPARTLPELVGVRTVPNEFGTDYAETDVMRTDLSASIPQVAGVGQTMQVTGVSKRVLRACDPGICFPLSDVDAGRVVHLQARDSAEAGWRTVSTATTAAKTGKYVFRVSSAGGRDYRVVAEAVGWRSGGAALAYAATDAVTTRSGGGGGGSLPITGGPVAWVAVGGVLLVGLGAGLILLGRRRRAVWS